MIFDYDLMFVSDEAGTQRDVTSGVLGSYVDLRVGNQGKGFPAEIALAFTTDTTATADPNIQFAIETADTSDFAGSITFPLMLPLPVKKADLKVGTILVSPLPKMGLKRYIRLKLGVDSPITCMGIKAGIVLDAPLN